MELFRLLGIIGIDYEEAKRAINDVVGSASDAQGKLSGAFSNIGSFAVKSGKVIAAGLAVGATAVGALTKQSIDQYAEYEQLVGGVETLFGNSADTVQWYALNAYKTAGMNANEYMSTVTSFSASLLQSLGNDTEAASKYADMAITDMSDNANKMGTDMSMIQNAYQGFAKQNYTMLDNLKLGYGGTKEEMERLIQDADKLSDTFSVSKDKNGDLVYSYADIVDAIHIVQTEMGITGTTAKEASGTIQGSVASTKASWQNLVGALSNGEADLGYFIDNFCETALTAIHNLVPRIGQALSGISEVIAQLMPVISAELPGLLEQLLPGLISGATALISGFVAALPTILQILIQQFPMIFQQLSTAVTETFPVLLETFKTLFAQIFDYISLELLGTETDFDTAFAKIQEIFNTALGVLQEVWNSIGQPVFDIVRSAVESAQEIFAEKMPEIEEFVSTCFTDIQSFWNNNLKPCLDAISNFIKTVLAPAFDVVFNSYIKAYVDTTFNKIKSLWENTLKPVFTGITDFLTGVFTLNFDQALTGVLNIATGIFNGILTAIQTPMELAKNVVNNAIDFIKEKFNFTWELPKLKLPHFSVSGKFSLNPPSIPSFSVSWYKKAMDNAMLLDSPTIFGASSNGLLGAGEAGQEVVSGANTLMGMISNAVAEQNSGLVEVLVKILNAITSMDGNMEDSFKNALDGTPFKVNNREFGRLVKAVT